MKKTTIILLALICLQVSGAWAQYIITFAGNGTPGFSGDGGPAVSAELYAPRGVAYDPSTGNIYIGDNYHHRIRMVTAAGIITTIAGNGTPGSTGDGGPASAAEVNTPMGMIVDYFGNLIFADYSANTVRKIVLGTGIISTVAGNGIAGYSGDGFAATSAELSGPFSVTEGQGGNIYIADGSNNVIREVSSGIITTAFGNYALGGGYAGDGGSASGPTVQFFTPMDITMDGSGSFYIADNVNNVIRRIDGSTNIITTVAGDNALGAGYSGDGAAATLAQLWGPWGVVTDGSGNIYIADRDNHVIRKVDVSGNIATIAGDNILGYSGDGGLATAAELGSPEKMVFDGSGNLYITDKWESRVRELVSSVYCINNSWLNITSTTDRHGNCAYTATATVSTTNLVLGYQWSGAGPAVIDHSHALSDVYTFTLPPGGSAVVSVTISVVDTNYTDTINGACCTSVLTQTVTCGGGEMPIHAPAATGKVKTPADDFSIFPNPSSNEVTVTSANSDITSIQVIDINAKKVGDYTYHNEQSVKIPMASLPPGTYLFRVNGSISKVVAKE